MTVISARNTGPTSHATARNPASTRTAAPAPTSITIALGSTGNRRRAVVGGGGAAAGGAAGGGAAAAGASGNGASGDDRAGGIAAAATGRGTGAAPPGAGVVMTVTVGSTSRPELTLRWWNRPRPAR